jgi:hypothetical protein
MLPGTTVLVAMQRSYNGLIEKAKQRKACQNPKSSLGWSGEQERDWKKAMHDCQMGMAFWIGSKCEPEAAFLDKPGL